jgi:hypothetical protein
VCLITKDPQREYKDLLQAKHVTGITKVPCPVHAHTHIYTHTRTRLMLTVSLCLTVPWPRWSDCGYLPHPTQPLRDCVMSPYATGAGRL